MKSVLYMTLMKEIKIPEEYLYQIFLHLYKTNKTNRELLLVQINSDSLSLFKRDNERINEERIVLPESIEDTLRELDKEYYVCIILTNVEQVKFVRNIVDEIITLNKGEIIRPLCSDLC